jgi:hypothetical protein
MWGALSDERTGLSFALMWGKGFADCGSIAVSRVFTHFLLVFKCNFHYFKVSVLWNVKQRCLLAIIYVIGSFLVLFGCLIVINVEIWMLIKYFLSYYSSPSLLGLEPYVGPGLLHGFVTIHFFGVVSLVSRPTPRHGWPYQEFYSPVSIAVQIIEASTPLHDKEVVLEEDWISANTKLRDFTFPLKNEICGRGKKYLQILVGKSGGRRSVRRSSPTRTLLFPCSSVQTLQTQCSPCI